MKKIMAIHLITSGICTYCGKLAKELEHVVPNSIIKELYNLGIMQIEYLVPSCVRCNRIVGTNCFETLQERIDFIQLREGIEEWRHPNLTRKICNAKLVTSVLNLQSSGKNSVLGNVETLIISGENERQISFSRTNSMRELAEERMTKKCEKCGTTFLAFSTRTKVYCSDFCRENKNYPGVFIGYV